MNGEELKLARINKHFTQKQLGLLVGYSDKSAERTVQAWEYGERPIPAEKYRKLSELLEIPLERFIP